MVPPDIVDALMVRMTGLVWTSFGVSGVRRVSLVFFKPIVGLEVQLLLVLIHFSRLKVSVSKFVVSTGGSEPVTCEAEAPTSVMGDCEFTERVVSTVTPVMISAMV